MSLIEKLAHLAGDRKVPVPAMPGLSVPTISFGSKATLKIIFFTVMVALGAVSVGMYFAIKDVTSSTYNWPEPAEYQVTADGLQTMGKKNEDYPDGTESQTLSIRLGDGVRISTLRIKDSDVGRTGIAKSLDISPLTTAVTGAAAYLWVGNLTITNSSFPTFAWENSEVGTLNVGMLCDGHTMSATVSNTVSDLDLSSERLASVYEVDSTITDRIQVHITGVNGAYVENLIIENLDAWNGAASFDRMKIGTATINNSNRVGDGTGVDSASCVISPSVSSRVINNTMQDRPIKVR